MKKFLAIMIAVAMTSSAAMALTLKKGQVLGGDGAVYDGASPEQIAVYVERAKAGGDAAGIVGQNVFVIVEDGITFVPVQDLSGKSKDAQMNIIGDAVVEEIAGTDAISFEQITELQEIAAETGVAIEDILKVDSALAELDADLAAVITDEIDTLIAEGALEDVQNFLSSDVLVENLATIAEVTQQVEAQLGELATEMDYMNACIAAADAETCEAIAEEME